ncbi:MAG: oxygen-independent coproporphyrinogen III oxidase [Hyphomicrobiales bacterium]|nr:oxygen-independent coproporphyrinogen III oxidase [Hyphomicrobiales bacterium]
MTVHVPSADTAPRYTSYPTAPHFHGGIDADAVQGWLRQVADSESVSLYVHIPFCDRLCWFCACHTRHTLRYEPVAAYLEKLHAEIAMIAALLPSGASISSIHFGGGSPTMLTPEDLIRLMHAIRGAFAVASDAAVSIEIDPNDMDEARLDAVAQVGATRASLGVQDFDPRVQRAINRVQSFEQTRLVVDGLRQRGVRAVNLDLVYGLPHQTIESMENTVARCLELRPDRFAIFGYAHVPWFKKHQTMIQETSLPGPAERLDQAARAAEIILEGGYAAVGIDHFALPGDSLARAAASGRLRRNFQGYTDDRSETLVGLGPSSISRYREGYAQNSPAMGDYTRAIAAGALPVARGIALNQEDRIRGWVIERLMCEFGFVTSELLRMDGSIGALVLREAEILVQSGQLRRQGERYLLAPAMRTRVRLVAAQFDSYLKRSAARHSLAV